MYVKCLVPANWCLVTSLSSELISQFERFSANVGQRSRSLDNDRKQPKFVSQVARHKTLLPDGVCGGRIELRHCRSDWRVLERTPDRPDVVQRDGEGERSRGRRLLVDRPRGRSHASLSSYPRYRGRDGAQWLREYRLLQACQHQAQNCEGR